MRKHQGQTLIELLLVAGVISLGMAGVLAVGSMVLEKSRQERAVAASLEIVANVQQSFVGQANFLYLSQNDAYFQGLFGPESRMVEGRVEVPPLGEATLAPVDEPIQGQSVKGSGFQLTFLGVPDHLCLSVAQSLGTQAHRMQVGTVHIDGQDGLPDLELLVEGCNQGREIRVAAVFIKHGAAETLSLCKAPGEAQQREVKCPTGQTGRQTQNRTGQCPGFYGDVEWSAWTTVSSTCIECPDPLVETTACPPGRYGSQQTVRTFDCEAETWGPLEIVSSDCQPCPTEPRTQEKECPGGQEGRIVEQQQFFCSQGEWGGWVMVENTCH